MIESIDPRPDERFIEIGPGHGALTRPLAARAQHVTAYEIDRDLAAELRAAAIPNVTIVEGDFLEQNPEPTCAACERGESASGDERSRAVRVAGNLPYNVAAPILFHLLDWARRGAALADATVMLQREVAERLLAAPGTRDYGVLTVLIRHRASVERVLSLPPGAFRPPPKVRSAVVRLRFHPPDPPVNDEVAFEQLVKAAFAQRRKTLANALTGRAGAWSGALERADGRFVGSIDLARRAETLSIAEFVELAKLLRNNT